MKSIPPKAEHFVTVDMSPPYLAVLMRKNSYANGSDAGAETQAIMMSVFGTLKLRGINPTDAVVKALRQFQETGQLPTLKSISTVDR